MSLAAPTAASRFDGNSLFALCSKAQGTNWQSGFCTAYMTAIADAMDNGNDVATYRACIPPQVGGKQIASIGVLYLKQHPDQLHYSAHSLIAAALQKSFPCSGQ
jgi:hypothetical protein